MLCCVISLADRQTRTRVVVILFSGLFPPIAASLLGAQRGRGREIEKMRNTTSELTYKHAKLGGT